MDLYMLIVLFQHIASVICSTVCLKLSIPIFINHKKITKNTKLSPVLMFFFIFVIISSILSFISRIYYILFWRSTQTIYDAKWLFWTTFPSFSAAYLGTVIEIILCIDRCISLQYPMEYTSKYQKCYCYVASIILLIFTAGYFYKNPVLAYIPVENSTNCKIFGCLLGDISGLTGFLYGPIGVNCIFAVVLLILIKTKLNAKTDANKRINKTVLSMIISSSFCDLFPNLVSTYLLDNFNIKLNTVIGPWSLTLLSVNMAICTFLYTKAFRETSKLLPSNRIVVVSNGTV